MKCQWEDPAKCLKLFKAIQHTNPMVNISFTQHGIYIMSMDRSKTSLVKLCLSTSYFKSYECPQAESIGVYTETLCNVLQKVKKHDMFWQTSETTLSIVCKHEQQKTEFTLRAIDIEEDQLDIPDLNDDVCIEINAKDFKDICDKLLMGKSDVSIIIDEQTLTLTSESTELGIIKHSEPLQGRIQCQKFNVGVNIALSFNSMYSLYIFSASDNTMTLGFSNEMPSRLKVHLGEDSFVSLYVAPKISDNE